MCMYMWLVFNGIVYYKYRKQLLRCNLFDEYVQMRADELVKERSIAEKELQRLAEAEARAKLIGGPIPAA